jgi:hypothetical protein
MTGIQGRRKELGNECVPDIPPVNAINIFLPPRHIKLDLIKCLVKAMAKTNSKGLNYLSNKFPNIKSAALKQGIFVGLCIREILVSLIDTERAA